MGFSLEATLIVPIILGSWAGLLALAAPGYQQEAQAAGQAVGALRYALENRHLYQTIDLAGGETALTALQVSPQVVVEWASLVQDDLSLVGRALGGGLQEVDQQAGRAGP